MDTDLEQYEERLGDIYCLTFIRDMDEAEALRRMGGLEDTVRPRSLDDLEGQIYGYDAGYAMIALAVRAGRWSVVIEPGGFEGSDAELLKALSRGTEAVSVLRHDYASDSFGYAVDGVLVAGFDPMWPDHRWGTEPDRLDAAMREVGFGTDEDRHAAALRLAGRITGGLPDLGDGALLSAEIEPWFSDADPSRVHRPKQAGLAEAIDAAAPPLRRAVAVREVRRLIQRIGLESIPELDDALARAERGEQVRVYAGSDLGLLVRDWLQGNRRAGNSLNDHSARHRMTEEDRTRAFQLGWLAGALRGALWSDSPNAAYEALRPLTSGPPWSADVARCETVLRVLQGKEPLDRLS